MKEERTNQNAFDETATQKVNNVDVNEATIQGKIVHVYAAEKATILTISTGRATAIPNYPKVVFFGETAKQAAEYQVGDFVKAVGVIQSSKRNPNIKNQVTLAIFGETICLAETQFEQDHGIPGLYAACINHFKLAGVITSIDIPAKNMARLTVKCQKNGRPSFVTLVHYDKDPAKIVAEHLPGSFIRVSGTVQTSKVKKKDGVRYYQSYITSEIK